MLLYTTLIHCALRRYKWRQASGSSQYEYHSVATGNWQQHSIIKLK